MGRKKSWHDLTHSVDTDLDLAPLLSIMVKLIPVLLLSSAFVHVVIIDTDLPQAVKSKIEENKLENKPEIELKLSAERGYEVVVVTPERKVEKVTIPLSEDRKFNFEALNRELIKVKERYPDVFELSLNPEPSVSYEVIIRTIDMARKPLKSKQLFRFYKNKELGEIGETEFMFPEIVFAHAVGG